MSFRAVSASAFVFAAFCNPCSGGEGTGNAPSTRPSLGTRGTSTMFIKRLEIMKNNSYSRSSQPLPAARAARNLSRYDAIGMAPLVSEHNRPAWRLLRQQHRHVLVFYYLSGVSARTDAAKLTYFDYDQIRPEWYLLDDIHDRSRADPSLPANRIRWSTSKPQSPDYNRFYIDVGLADFQRWAAQRILEHVSGKSQGLEYAYDGFVMDNVTIGSERMRRIDHYHRNWKYAGDHKAWNEAYFAYLKTVKDVLNRNGYLLFANHTLAYGSDEDDRYWDEFLRCVDGALTEKPLGYGRERYASQAWLKSIERHEQIIRQGVINWWVFYPPATEPEGHGDFMFGYCSWLLVREPGRSLFLATRGDPGYSNPQPPWYEEYDLSIGSPTSKRYHDGPCWIRNYGHVRVVVNPTHLAQQVSFEDGVERIDWTTKRTRNQFTIPPVSGRILLPVP